MRKKELKRRTKVKSKERKENNIFNKNFKITLLVISIITLIICFLYLGKTLTLLLAIMIGIIPVFGLYCQKKVKKEKKYLVYY